MKLLNHTIAGKFGSRRGFVRTVGSRLKYFANAYRDMGSVDWAVVDRLIFVCKGNICRSAFSQVVAENLGLLVASCGVDTQEGFPANDDAIRIASERGVDLSKHKTTPIQMLDKRPGDIFIAMEPWHVEKIQELYGDRYRYTLLGLWGKPVTPYIHDPYGASDSYFHHCFDYLEKTVNEISKKIR